MSTLTFGWVLAALVRALLRRRSSELEEVDVGL